jgi:membrane protein YqaA with SNARE-associated domain
MLEKVVDIGLYLVREHGLTGLFFLSFASATIFVPASAELAFPILVISGVNKLLILSVATTGSTLGAIVNYYIGYGGERLVDKYIKRKDLENAHRIMNRYGWVGLFGALALPVPGDPFTVLCGLTKMDLKEFTAVSVAAKMIKYAVILELISIIL